MRRSVEKTVARQDPVLAGSPGPVVWNDLAGLNVEELSPGTPQQDGPDHCLINSSTASGPSWPNRRSTRRHNPSSSSRREPRGRLAVRTNHFARILIEHAAAGNGQRGRHQVGCVGIRLSPQKLTGFGAKDQQPFAASRRAAVAAAAPAASPPTRKSDCPS